MTFHSRRQVLTAMTLLGAGLLAGCGGPVNTSARMLPQDRAAPLMYVALGDSAVAGAGASRPEWSYVSLLHRWLRSVYPQAELRNLGVGGATAADVARDQVGPAVQAGPHLVTLSVGPNDITGGRSVQDYEGDLDRIVGTLARDTRAVIVATLLPDLAMAPRFSGQEKERVGQQTTVFNDAVRRIGARYGVPLVDLYTISQQEVPSRPELVSGDAYHPSDQGYLRWAELTWNVIEPKIPRP